MVVLEEQPRRTPPPRTLTSPFEYSVATCCCDDEEVSVREREVELPPTGVTERSIGCWSGVEGVAVEVREARDEMLDVLLWFDEIDSERWPCPPRTPRRRGLVGEEGRERPP